MPIVYSSISAYLIANMIRNICRSYISGGVAKYTQVTCIGTLENHIAFASVKQLLLISGNSKQSTIYCYNTSHHIGNNHLKVILMWKNWKLS